MTGTATIRNNYRKTLDIHGKLPYYWNELKGEPMTNNAPYGCQTYKDLLILLQTFTSEQLDCTPTLYDSDNDEYYPVTTILTASETNDVLDENHPYLSL